MQLRTPPKKITEERGIRLVLNLDGVNRKISAETKYNLVRIAQEAVLNAAKHSGASTIEVSFLGTKQEVRLCVSDDGHGMAYPQQGGDECGHYGIVGMRERAEHIGGIFESCEHSPDPGQTVAVRILGD